MNRLLKQLFKIPAKLAAPLMGTFVSLKRFFSVRNIIGRLSNFILRAFKKVFCFRPKSKKDYYKIGRYYIFKNLIYFIILAICMVPFFYFRFFAKPVVSTPTIAEGKVNTFLYTQQQLEFYSGRAKILSSGNRLRYEGEVENGLCTGEGRLYNIEGVLVYDGGFHKNEYTGEGKEYYSLTGNLKYRGAFENNLYEGEGILYFPDGVTKRYEGEFFAGLFHGKGILYDSNGLALYEGQFKEGLYDGEGRENFPFEEKPLYIGSFSKGFKEGEGALYNRFGAIIFQGPFTKDEINIAAFLGQPQETLQTSYQTNQTQYRYDTLEDKVLKFDGFTDLFVIGDTNRVERIIQLETALVQFMQTSYYTGETYADEADLAALNVSGLRKDFKKISAGVHFTENLYRPQKMYVKTYVLEDVLYSAFSEEKDGAPLYYVIEQKTT